MSTVRNQPGKPGAPSDGKRSTREKSDQLGWSRAARVSVSLLILWHLFGVFIGPFSIPPASSEVVRSVALSPPVSWYITPLFLNSGYHFFAPDPPERSGLIRYRVTRQDGTKVEGKFPDLDKQWPRLRYHRYMMLAEQCKIPVRNEVLDLRAQAMVRTFARHLLREFDGVEARLEYVYHDVLHRDQFLGDGGAQPGVKIDDERTFRVVDVVTQTDRDLEDPVSYPHLAPSDANWQTGELIPPRSGP